MDIIQDFLTKLLADNDPEALELRRLTRERALESIIASMTNNPQDAVGAAGAAMLRVLLYVTMRHDDTQVLTLAKEFEMRASLMPEFLLPATTPDQAAQRDRRVEELMEIFTERVKEDLRAKIKTPQDLMEFMKTEAGAAIMAEENDDGHGGFIQIF